MWLFFALVFGWSWSIWLLAAGAGANVQTQSGWTLLLVGALGPMLGGIGFTWFTENRQGWRDYWLRIVDPRRIRPAWYLIILFFVPGVMAAAVLLDAAIGTGEAPALIGERARPFLAAPSTIVPFLLGVLIMGPVPEEAGWRGYALDRLQAKWSPPIAGLILGAAWALWHLPLFFLKGTIHNAQGVGSAWFWLFMVQVVAMAVILTWIFNNTRRSTFGAILFHFIANLAYALGNVTQGTNFYAAVIWVVSAIAVIAAGGLPTASSKRSGAPIA